MSAPTSVRPPARAPHRVEPGAGPRDGRPDVRRTLLALLAAALGVTPLCDLVTGYGWLVDVWLTMAVAVLPAAALRRRHAPAAAQVWVGVALMVPWLTVNFVRGHAVAGVLPLAGAWHDVGRLMTQLHTTMTDESAPVHAGVAVRLALCAVLGLVAALVDLLAVVGRRAALAGVPLLIVFTVAGAVPRRPVSWTWFVLAAIGFLILLALDSSDDLERWGHRVPRASGGARRAGRFASAQRVAVVAVALAVLVPFVLPANSRNFVANLFHPATSGDTGFGADSANGSGTGGIDPFAALRGDLIRNKQVPLLQVSVQSGEGVGTTGRVQPFYLRTNVLPDFVGSGWRAAPGGRSENLDGTDFASAPGTAFAPSVVRFTATVKDVGLRSNPPVFGSPVSVAGLPAGTKWDPRTMLLVGSRLQAGDIYDEVVSQPHPSVAELRSASAVDPAMQEWTALPKIAPFVRQLTAGIVRSARTPYDKARAISDFFANPANGFSYSLSTGGGDSGDDLTNFLRNRVGFCQQYAAAMGVMLRLAGVPARVVLGYAHDVPDPSGSFTVTNFDAHAWVEAYFTGIGWVPFDPTPLAGISGGAGNDLSWAPHAKAGTAGPGSRPSTAPAAPSTAPTQHSTPPAAAAPAAAPTSFTEPLVLLLVVLAVLALLLLPASVRRQRRRSRLRRARDGDAEASWAELSDTATDLEFGWSPARTPRQVAGALATPLAGCAPALDALRALVAAVEVARYAPSGGGAGGAHLVTALTAVERELRARRPARTRLRAFLWPASLGRANGASGPARARLRRLATRGRRSLAAVPGAAPRR